LAIAGDHQDDRRSTAQLAKSPFGSSLLPLTRGLGIYLSLRENKNPAFDLLQSIECRKFIFSGTLPFQLSIAKIVGYVKFCKS
jgi:hypothetical protein